jgi:ribose transport system substrate-binding protein
MIRYSNRLVAVALALGLVASACGGGGSAPAGRKQIAVIPKGTTNEFWKAIHAGAVKAANERGGVDIIWKGPIREDDRDEQIKIVENFVSKGVDGIVLAPLDDQALVPVLNDAKGRGIPVVIFDSSVKWDDYVSFVATDNYKAGALGAERLAEVMGGKGDAILLRYAEGSASTMEREAGFLDTIKTHPGINVVSSNRYAGATVEPAYAAAENLLSTYKTVQGMFTPNESTTLGTLLALRAAGRLDGASGVKLVGFDAGDKLVEALEKGDLYGLVLQNPLRMADLAVNALLDSLAGKTVDKRIDTGEYMITPQNMKQPDMDALLHPPVDQYLK